MNIACITQFSFVFFLEGDVSANKQAKMSHKEMQHIAKIKIRNRHQHNTDDGEEAMGEEMRHVHMSKCGKHIGEASKQQ